MIYYTSDNYREHVLHEGHAAFLRDHAVHLLDYIRDMDREARKGSREVMLDDIGQIEAHLRAVKRYIRSINEWEWEAQS